MLFVYNRWPEQALFIVSEVNDNLVGQFHPDIRLGFHGAGADMG